LTAAASRYILALIMRGGGFWNGGVEADAEKLAPYTELEENLGALRRQPVHKLEIVPKATVAEIDLPRDYTKQYGEKELEHAFKGERIPQQGLR
jgi:hypothetical protein